MNTTDRQQLLPAIIVSLAWLGSGVGFAWLTMCIENMKPSMSNIVFALSGMSLLVLLTCRALGWIYPETTRAHLGVLSLFILVGTAVALQVLPASWAISFNDPFGLYAFKALAVFGLPLLMPLVTMVHLLGRSKA